jgi:hypothetical protein
MKTTKERKVTDQLFLVCRSLSFGLDGYKFEEFSIYNTGIPPRIFFI